MPESRPTIVTAVDVILRDIAMEASRLNRLADAATAEIAGVQAALLNAAVGRRVLCRPIDGIMIGWLPNEKGRWRVTGCTDEGYTTDLLGLRRELRITYAKYLPQFLAEVMRALKAESQAVESNG